MKPCFKHSLCILSLFVFSSYSQPKKMNPEGNSGVMSQPCDVPENTDILHLPIQTSKASYLELLQLVQSTQNFIERNLNIGSDKSKNDRNNSHGMDTERQITFIDEKAYPHFFSAQLIKKISNSFIFHELFSQIYDIRDINALNLKDDIFVQTPEQFRYIDKPALKHIVELIKNQFPEGLPEEYSDLKKNQKQSLIIVGAPLTLLILNEIPLIFPFFSNSDYRKYGFSEACSTQYNIFKNCPFSQEIMKVLKVEKMVSNVKTILKSFPDSNKRQIAILIYNGRQNLEEYFYDMNFYKMPDNCLSITTK